jgi:hypothetical protein
MATYLLVEVDDAEAAAVEAFIGTVGGVELVYVHGDCCCTNCPWNGNHG